VSQPLPVLPLSALPDPPANWPPGGVQVPRVFQLTGGEPSPEDGPGTSDPDDSDPDVIDPDVIDLGVIDLGVIDLEVADPQIIDLTDPGPLPEMEPPPEMAEVPTSVDDDHAVGATTASNAEDPWLAFAAAMFRDD
jgi:hypothetical protein